MTQTLLSLLLLLTLSKGIISSIFSSSIKITEIGKTQPKEFKLKVMTINIFNWNENWAQRKNLIVDLVLSYDPDIIAWQEIREHINLDNQLKQLHELINQNISKRSNTKRYNSIYSPSMLFRFDQEGLGISSKFPIKNWLRKPLTQSCQGDGNQRTVFGVTLYTIRGPIFFFVSHYSFQSYCQPLNAQESWSFISSYIQQEIQDVNLKNKKNILDFGLFKTLNFSDISLLLDEYSQPLNLTSHSIPLIYLGDFNTYHLQEEAQNFLTNNKYFHLFENNSLKNSESLEYQFSIDDNNERELPQKSGPDLYDGWLELFPKESVNDFEQSFTFNNLPNQKLTARPDRILYSSIFSCDSIIKISHPPNSLQPHSDHMALFSILSISSSKTSSLSLESSKTSSPSSHSLISSPSSHSPISSPSSDSPISLPSSDPSKISSPSSHSLISSPSSHSPTSPSSPSSDSPTSSPSSDSLISSPSSDSPTSSPSSDSLISSPSSDSLISSHSSDSPTSSPSSHSPTSSHSSDSPTSSPSSDPSKISSPSSNSLSQPLSTQTTISQSLDIDKEMSNTHLFPKSKIHDRLHYLSRHNRLYRKGNENEALSPSPQEILVASVKPKDRHPKTY